MQNACWRWWGRAVMVGLALILPALVCAAENSPSGRYAEIPGVKLWFTDTGGTGTPIVLLHANTGTSASWEPQATAFSREGYRVIAFDRRGWGKSFGTSGNMLRWCISSARADVVIKVALRP